MALTAQNIGDWLGHPVDRESDLEAAVQNRLPFQALTNMLARGLTREEIHSVIVAVRTLKHRKANSESLSIQESDRALRMARVLAKAETVFGNRTKTLSWMRAPKKRFAGKTPMVLLQTEAGARLVEQMLIQIDEGMFA